MIKGTWKLENTLLSRRYEVPANEASVTFQEEFFTIFCFNTKIFKTFVYSKARKRLEVLWFKKYSYGHTLERFGFGPVFSTKGSMYKYNV